MVQPVPSVSSGTASSDSPPLQASSRISPTAACYTLWKTGPGALMLDLRRAGEALLRPSVSIVTAAGAISIPREDEGDIARFTLSDEDVARLLSPRDGLRPPCIMLQCDAFLALTSSRRRWGWAVRLSRGGVPLNGHLLDGRPIPLARDGFTRPNLRHIPAGTAMAHGHAIIGLA